MSKVTSKLQVTLPKAIAERYGIRPGDDIDWQAAGDVIRVVPSQARAAPDAAHRLEVFDRATERQRRRNRRAGGDPGDRGWTRADLYQRGRSR